MLEILGKLSALTPVKHWQFFFKVFRSTQNAFSLSDVVVVLSDLCRSAPIGHVRQALDGLFEVNGGVEIVTL